jgi:hypothetical protein
MERLLEYVTADYKKNVEGKELLSAFQVVEVGDALYSVTRFKKNAIRTTFKHEGFLLEMINTNLKPGEGDDIVLLSRDFEDV